MAWYGTKKASKLPSLDKNKILVFDTETTGIEPSIDEILQITILNGYGEVLFNSYIKPKHHKSWKAAEAKNHINYEMVKNAPAFSDVRSEIQELFNNASLVVGYKVNFDINFVQAEGIVVSGQDFDVMTAFASYLAAITEPHLYRKYHLTECAEYFGYSFSPHDSAEDALATLHCFNCLIDDPRFTTYKPAEKKKLKEDMPPGSRKRPHADFNLQFSTHRRHNVAITGLILIFAAEILLYLTGHDLISNGADYVLYMENILTNLSTDRYVCILYIIFWIGLVFLTLGIIQFLIRLPRTISAKFKHFVNKFR